MKRLVQHKARNRKTCLRTTVLLLVVIITSYFSNKMVAQKNFMQSLDIEVGLPIASQFIDKTYNYNSSNNNTIGGLGGVKFAAIYHDKYKLEFTWSNCDDLLFSSGSEFDLNYEKNFNSIVSLSKIYTVKSLNL